MSNFTSPQKYEETNLTSLEDTPTLPALSISTYIYEGGKNPFVVYWMRLAAKSRPMVVSCLSEIAWLICRGAEARSFPWHLLRYEHLQAVRALLLRPKLNGQGKLFTPKPATVNTKMAHLRGVLKESWRLGYMTAEEYARAIDVGRISHSSLPAGRDLYIKELQLLFEVCAADRTDAGRRDAAMIALLYGCGLRRSEIPALNLEDYSSESGELKILGAKKRKDRIVYLMDEGAKRALAPWILVRGRRPGALFCPVNKHGYVDLRKMTDQAVYNAMEKRRKAAGVKKFSPHDFRRT
jgi:integrase